MCNLDPKIWIFGKNSKQSPFFPQTSKFSGQNCTFLSQGIRNFGAIRPIVPHADRKTMQTRCPGVFSVTWVTKLLLPLVKIRIFGPGQAKFCPKNAVLGTYRPVHLVPLLMVVVVRGLYIARLLFTLLYEYTNTNRQIVVDVLLPILGREKKNYCQSYVC